MSDSEQAICGRLRKFRRATGLSQAEFSDFVGLDARVYASYEYARSRLNYTAAWRILSAFRVLNPRWLAEGKGIPFEVFFAPYATSDEMGLGPRALFSMAYERFLKKQLANLQSLWMFPEHQPLPYFPINPSMRGRVAAKDVLTYILVDWLAAQPDSQLSDFVNSLLQAGAALLKKYPAERGTERKKRFTELFQIEAKRRMVLPAFADENRVLTGVAESGKLSPVKSQMKNLLADLNRLTSEPGKKTELADFLGAPLTSVSRWLSGEREPGGETTLRLLHWVEQQERQQNTLGSAINTAKGKTRVGKSHHEKQTHVQEKR
jgi:transcriptional regulator with XRE-family HTH domain